MVNSSDVRMKPGEPERHLGLTGRAFRLLVLATVATFSGYLLLLPVVPLWAARGGAGEVGAGATTAVFMLTTVVTQLAMPWLLDRGGYRWTFPAGALVLGLPAPLFLLTTDLWPLIAVSAVRGIGFGMITVVGAALAARLVPPDQIGRATGYYGFAVGIPNVVLLPFGVWLALNAGFAPVFWIAALGPALGAVAAAGIWLAAGDGTGRSPGAGVRRAATAATRGDRGRHLLSLAAPLLLMLVAAIASSAVVTFLAIPLERAAPVAAAALLGYGMASVATRWVAGTLSDRHGRPVLLVPSVLAVIAGMALAAAAVWPAGGGWAGPGAAGAVAVVAGAVLFGAGFGAVQNDTITVMFRRSGPPRYGTASAAWNIGIDGGTGAGALGLGIVIQALGYGPGFALTALAMALCLPAAVRVARRAG
ncbi:MFS transporter [Nocardiopsis mangrovi]|uniref:MFS transporter n=1 Tax=Nocardiopsis mangrovi TaxID=1179818 RepID=A0ABV9DTT2_9ACTN